MWFGGIIDFKLFGGFGDSQIDRPNHRHTIGHCIGGCRVAFATENHLDLLHEKM